MYMWSIIKQYRVLLRIDTSGYTCLLPQNMNEIHIYCDVDYGDY